jgi:hypothetical protein
MKYLLAVLAVIGSIATPASAQSFSARPYGTGHVLPFAYQSSAPQRGLAAVDRSALNAYAARPGAALTGGSDDPALTGGGSVGYNELLRTPF